MNCLLTMASSEYGNQNPALPFSLPEVGNVGTAVPYPFLHMREMRGTAVVNPGEMGGGTAVPYSFWHMREMRGYGRSQF